MKLFLFSLSPTHTPRTENPKQIKSNKPKQKKPAQFTAQATKIVL